MTPAALVAGIADLALSPVAVASDRADGGARAVRLGIDGPVEADTTALADAVADELARRAVPVARVRASDFLRARSLRLEHGPDDADAFFDGWYDAAALRREVLDPLGPDGDGTWLPRLRNPETDRPYRERSLVAAPGTVAVVDGRFLTRWDLADAFDAVVHLVVTPAGRARRVPSDEQARVLPAWERYLEWCDPPAAAALAVRYDHPDRPALVGS